QAATELEPQQLTIVEQIPVTNVSPLVQTGRFVPGRNRIVGDEPGIRRLEERSGRLIPPKVLLRRLLEEAALMVRLASRAVVFYSEHPMLAGPRSRIRELVLRPALAGDGSPLGRAGDNQAGSAGRTVPWLLQIGRFVEFATGAAN